MLPVRDYAKLLESRGERPVTVKRCETVEEVLREADVVSLHCNLDDNTRHLMNAERLGMMKRDAVLVNAARGPCIDEAALVAHLKANPSFRAGAFGVHSVGAAGLMVACVRGWARFSLSQPLLLLLLCVCLVAVRTPSRPCVLCCLQHAHSHPTPHHTNKYKHVCPRHHFTGLDVFEDEPAMKPGLAECENAVIVPHIASATLWTRAGMVRAAGCWRMRAHAADRAGPV